MEITWYGHSCFRLSERGYATITTDPFDDSVGYPVPKIKADIVTVSHDAPGHNNTAAVKGARPILGPGEYEIGGVFITGIATARPDGKKKKDSEGSQPNTLYLFDFDGLTVCHLGDLDHVPTQAQIEDLGTVNVALVPVGGGGGLNAAQAAEVISLIEPSIVVPMHYKTPETSLKLDPLSKFLKEMGLGNLKPEDALKVTKSQLPEETQVVALNYRGQG
ncbi:MAG: MBL fold metallo-hydrolase [Chloroflexi bacterium]|nr:MBL fold metallo-hydrolase [Chloroflexota bacterium]MBI3764104.1 MBL fold metallo-hydrolase [Chloroflexota bacterium]